MDTRLMWWPVVAQAALTFVVWLRMYFVRVGQMKRGRIHPQSVATSAQMAARLSDTRAADNFRNLFELPVLFYFGLVVAERAGAVDGFVIGLAWVFALLRVAHSAIHCTYNKVMHRFYAYLAGVLVLWALLGVIASRVIKA